MKKKILLVLGGLVVLVVIALVLVGSNLGKLIQVGVEKGGPMVLGVPTTLDKATVSVRRGEVGLDGLALGSPEGFDAESMFSLDHVHTSVDIGSLRSDEIVVNEVVIDGPRITLEFSGGRTNWGALLSELESPAEEEKEKEAGQKKIRIGRILLSNAKVSIAGIPLAGTATVPLPRLEMTDIGSADGGVATVRNVLADVIRSLYKSILTAAADVLPTEQIKQLGDEALSLLGDAGGLALKAGAAAGDTAAGAAKGAAGAVKGAAGAATGALRGVFGGGDKDEE